MGCEAREIVWQRAFKSQRLAGHGVGKAQKSGMKGLTLQGLDCSAYRFGDGVDLGGKPGAIDCVSKQGVPDMGEMHADLVGASGL